MKTRICTSDEIKLILGQSSINAALIDMWNDMAMDMLCEVLSIDEIATHVVTDERVTLSGACEMALNDIPVKLTPAITIKDVFGGPITGYTWKMEPHGRRVVKSYDSNGVYPMNLPYDEVLVTYTAGYTVQDSLKVLLNTLTGKTIKARVLGVETTYTFIASGTPTSTQILIGASVNDTASAIATKIGGSVSTDTVTAPLGTTLTLGTVSTSDMTLTSADLPASFKMIVALIVGGGIAEKTKSGGVTAYSIGKKSVQFRNQQEANTVDGLLKQWMPTYRKVSLHSC